MGRRPVERCGQGERCALWRRVRLAPCSVGRADLRIETAGRCGDRVGRDRRRCNPDCLCGTARRLSSDGRPAPDWWAPGSSRWKTSRHNHCRWPRWPRMKVLRLGEVLRRSMSEPIDLTVASRSGCHWPGCGTCVCAAPVTASGYRMPVRTVKTKVIRIAGLSSIQHVISPLMPRCKQNPAAGR